MRTITLTLSLLLALIALPVHARAADGASVRAILITASKDKAPADARLAPFEETLQRNLPESSFRFVAEGTASVAGNNSKARISLGGTQSIELEGGSREADGIHLKVQWFNGKTMVVGLPFIFQPGVPVVLGHRKSNDGDVPIVIMVAK
jgi:hypothetical protein